MTQNILTNLPQITLSTSKHESLLEFLRVQTYSKVLVISDQNVFHLFGNNLMNILDECNLPLCEPFLFPAGEYQKNLKTAENCWNHMQNTLDRKSLVIALGGGVVTDLAGFAAACYMRGIDYVSIPTTLLGMVDASIGGKTAVNLPTGKNLIGAFYQPKLIDISMNYLETLPKREFISGLAEVIKYGIIQDLSLFDYLQVNSDLILLRDLPTLQNIIETSAKIKNEIVALDEREMGLRAILNFGHTFGHALETLTHYQTYVHGEAVSIGMCCAAYVSFFLGLAERSVYVQIKELCHMMHLPTSLPDSLDLNNLISQMSLDKKALSNKIHLIVVRKIGKVEKISDIDPLIIKKALTEMKQ